MKRMSWVLILPMLIQAPGPVRAGLAPFNPWEVDELLTQMKYAKIESSQQGSGFATPQVTAAAAQMIAEAKKEEYPTSGIEAEVKHILVSTSKAGVMDLDAAMAELKSRIKNFKDYEHNKSLFVTVEIAPAEVEADWLKALSDVPAAVKTIVFVGPAAVPAVQTKRAELESKGIRVLTTSTLYEAPKVNPIGIPVRTPLGPSFQPIVAIVGSLVGGMTAVNNLANQYPGLNTMYVILIKPDAPEPPEEDKIPKQRAGLPLPKML